MYIEKIKSITKYDFCVESYFESTDEILWQFGWDDGIHFYLSIFRGEYFALNVWHDKKQLLAIGTDDFNEIYSEITSIVRSIKNKKQKCPT